jgi:uncharacterized protein (TIGR02453 family)
MAYFTSGFTTFFRQLSRNNKREWYHANKTAYEEHVKEPFNEFVGEMIHRVAAVDPNVAIEPKDAIFRLARDTRFSKDKTPYKTWAAAVISRGGRKGMHYPALFFRLDHKGVSIGGGMYQPDKDDVHKIRQAIQDNGKKLSRALHGKKFTELYGELRGEKNKRVPKEFAADVEKHPLIANKQFYYYAEYEDPGLPLRNDLAEFVMRHYRAGSKVNDFLREAVD